MKRVRKKAKMGSKRTICLFVLVFMLAIVVLAGCLGYMKIARLPEMDKLFDGIYTFKSEVKFAKGFENPEPFEGNAFCLNNGLLITASHLAWPEKYYTPFMTPLGMMGMESSEPVEAKYIMEDVELSLVSYSWEWDLAVLKPDKKLVPFPAKLGNSDELRVGQRMFMVGNPYLSFFDIREGMVSSLKPIDKSKSVFKDFAADPEAYFSVSCGIAKGDSGMPVVAIKNGEFYIMGIAIATFEGENLGWAVKVNYLKKLLDSIDA